MTDILVDLGHGRNAGPAQKRCNSRVPPCCGTCSVLTKNAEFTTKSTFSRDGGATPQAPGYERIREQAAQQSRKRRLLFSCCGCSWGRRPRLGANVITNLPRSATRGYGCAILDPWFFHPDQFVLHHFFKGQRWSANIRKGIFAARQRSERRKQRLGDLCGKVRRKLGLKFSTFVVFACSREHSEQARPEADDIHHSYPQNFSSRR